MPETLKEKSIKGIMWAFTNKCSVKIVQFLVSIILARLLTPEDYGVVGLAYVVIALAGCFGELGLGNAIIRKQYVDELDYNTVFWTDSVIRVFIWIIICYAAPFIAEYYSKPELKNVIRCLTLTMPVGIWSSIPSLKLTRQLDFKRIARISFISCLISCIAAVICAYKGMGVWALVIQNFLATAVGVPLTLYVMPWCPRFTFSIERLREFWGFGSKLMCSGILDVAYGNLTGLMIGKVFSIQDLGFYSKGHHIPSLSVEAINGPINGVAFSMLSKLQGDKVIYRNALRKSLRTSIFFVAPLMVGLCVTAKPLIELLYGKQWMPAVPFMQIVAIISIFYPVHSLNLCAINALGHSGIFLKLEILKKLFGIIVMCVFFRFGLVVFVASGLLGTIFGIFVNTLPLRKLIGYSTVEQLRDIGSSLFGSFVMLIALYPLNFVQLNGLLIFCIQVIVGIVIYLVVSLIFSRDLLFENIDLLKKILLRKG